MGLFFKLLLFLAALSAFQLQARAASELSELNNTKGLVKLSLWYEGTVHFNDSMFNAEKREEMAKALLNQEADSGVELSDELQAALKKVTY